MKASEAYKRLYHYTDSGGLLGILRTNTLWATRYDCLRDSSEIVFAKDELILRIRRRVREEYEKLIRQSADLEQKINQQGGLDQISQHDADVFVKAHYKATGDEIYILSFCEHHNDSYVSDHGLLSQWRAYGVGGGFALVFDTHRLEEMLHAEAERFAHGPMHLSDVVYSHDEEKLERELSGDLSVIANSVANFFRVVTSEREKEERETCFLDSYEPFFNCITRLKHRGFYEENEIRLTVLRTVRDQELSRRAGREDVTLAPEKKVKVRDRNGQLVPYIELFDSANMKLPIERIIVGPHKDKEARASALRQMLSNTGIEITCSDIPYI